MTAMQEEMVALTNPDHLSGGLAEAVVGADIFIGVSAPRILSPKMVQTQIIPQAMNFDIAPALAAAVAQAAMDSGVARLCVDPQVVAQHCQDFIYEGILTPVPPLE